MKRFLAALERFETAAHDYAFIGAADPLIYNDIGEEYKKAKEQLILEATRLKDRK